MAMFKDASLLDIPVSDATIDVSIIDTTTRMAGLPLAMFTSPPMPGFEYQMNGISYSFLLKHRTAAAPTKNDTLMFDLGVRKDMQNAPAKVLEQMSIPGFSIGAEKDVFDILTEHGDDPAAVGAIIWSHYHMDHTGDPSRWPASTSLLVGPGFKSHILPAWPTDANSTVDSSAWAGRTLTELSFSGPNALTLGGYRALDYYADGSLYLLDTPGHTVGHICALARTTGGANSDFILLGGDVAHHGAEFRPTEYVPLPATLEPNPLVAPYTAASFACPGAIFEAIHPEKSSCAPFLKVTGPVHDDPAGAQESVEKLFPFDAMRNVFPVIAHDFTLFDVVEMYPQKANAWRAKGWKEMGHWRFLRDFETGVEGMKAQ